MGESLNVHSIREFQIRAAREEDVRRLSRFCGIKEAGQPLALVIDELSWKGIVTLSHSRGYY